MCVYTLGLLVTDTLTAIRLAILSGTYLELGSAETICSIDNIFISSVHVPGNFRTSDDCNTQAFGAKVRAQSQSLISVSILYVPVQLAIMTIG